MTEEGAELLAAIVAARSAFLVTGGTGTGKTTLLAAMLSLADPGERLVLVEDSSELRPAHPHVVGLEARPPNIEGAGEITLRTLVRQALRMRPDRLVVGEVRGRRGGRDARGAQHRPRRRVRHRARQLRRRRAGPARGAGPGGRAARGRPCTASSRPPSTSWSTWPAGPTAYAAWPRSACPRRGPDGLVVLEVAVSFDAGGRVERGPAARELSRRISP